MGWGSARTGEGICDIIGSQRLLIRDDVQRYRSWPFYKFMLTFVPSVFKQIWPWFLAHTLLAICLYFIHTEVHAINLPNNKLLKVLTAPTSFLLLFRCNMGYQRFWEGRGYFETFNFALREVTRRCYTFVLGADVHDSEAAAVRHNVLRLLMVMAISVRTDLRKRSLEVQASEE